MSNSNFVLCNVGAANLKHRYLPLTIVVLLWLPFHSQGQIQLLSSSQGRSTAVIKIAEGQLVQEGSSQIQGSALQSMGLTLHHDDLLIEYTLSSGKSKEIYRVDFQASLNGSPLNIHAEDLLGDFHKDTPASAGQKRIVWTNLLDRYYVFEGTLELTLKVELWGEPTLPFGIECGEVPTFSSKQRLPYYLVAGLGAATIGLSAVIGADAKKIYEEDYLQQRFEQAAEPFYEEANNKRHTELLLRYAGIGILIGDAALFFYRNIRQRKKVDAYNEFCGSNRISISPMYQSNATPIEGEQLGLKLSYTF